MICFLEDKEGRSTQGVLRVSYLYILQVLKKKLKFVTPASALTRPPQFCQPQVLVLFIEDFPNVTNKS